jgi:SAM-dependent methyltransferase
MTAEYFDQWFADIGRSAERQRLFTDGLGLPAEVGPSNLLPLEGLQTVARALRLELGGVLIDLACGRGGPGMWLARELGATLIGLDFSAMAISQATDRRALFGLEDTATFQVGTLEATGLPAGTGDAAVCVDAFQFADDGVAAAMEMRRVLRPGGRAVLTSWEPTDRAAEVIGGRIANVDLAGWLNAAGFLDVVSEDHPDWHARAQRFWQGVLTVDPAGDPALISTVGEAERSLVNHDHLRRVMATAVAP